MKSIIVMTGIIWATILCGIGMAEPFAPLVDIPEDLSGSDISFLEAATAQKSIIPSKEEVGIPAYPGAKILFTQMDIQIEQTGGLVEMLNRIFMGTPDSMEQVVDFYREQLDDWNYSEIGGVSVFHKKDGDFDPKEDLTTQKVVISPEQTTGNLMPSSETTIDLYYISKQS